MRQLLSPDGKDLERLLDWHGDLRRVRTQSHVAGSDRNGMRHRSRKRQREYATERIPLVIRLLEQNPICQRCWRQRSVDVHELLSRARGGSITDESNLVCLCRPCHDLITRNPQQAKEQGWSRSKQGK